MYVRSFAPKVGQKKEGLWLWKKALLEKVG
jgi:hypothetical protein